MLQNQNPPDFQNIPRNFYNKYLSRNPIVKFLMKNFFKKFDALIMPLDTASILEVGCGEGELQKHVANIKKESTLYGIDINENIIHSLQNQNLKIMFDTQSATKIQYPDSTFDLVIASEVLEHIPDYFKALCEINRVGKRYFLFSVPHEPIWRILNVLCFRYISHKGNTPGHINHWSRSSFIALLEKNFIIRKEQNPFPWLMVLCEKKYYGDTKI